jgi:hypothetical protein
MSIIKDMEAKFTSGNSIPVTRSTITLEEWELLKQEIKNLKNDTLNPSTLELVKQTLTYLGNSSGTPSMEGFAATIDSQLSYMCRAILAKSNPTVVAVGVFDEEPNCTYVTAVNADVDEQTAWDFAQQHINNAVMDEVEDAAKWKAVRLVAKT